MRETIFWKRLMEGHLYLQSMHMHKPMTTFLLGLGEWPFLGLVQLSRSWSKVGTQFFASLSTFSHENALSSVTSVLRKTELKLSEQRAFISEATIWSIRSSTYSRQFGWRRHCEASDSWVPLARCFPIFFLEGGQSVVFYIRQLPKQKEKDNMTVTYAKQELNTITAPLSDNRHWW